MILPPDVHASTERDEAGRALPVWALRPDWLGSLRIVTLYTYVDVDEESVARVMETWKAMLDFLEELSSTRVGAVTIRIRPDGHPTGTVDDAAVHILDALPWTRLNSISTLR